MHCTSCGTALREGAKFCPSCGTPAKASAPTPTPEPAPAPTPPPAAQPEHAAPDPVTATPEPAPTPAPASAPAPAPAPTWQSPVRQSPARSHSAGTAIDFMALLPLVLAGGALGIIFGAGGLAFAFGGDFGDGNKGVELLLLFIGLAGAAGAAVLSFVRLNQSDADTDALTIPRAVLLISAFALVLGSMNFLATLAS